MVRVSKGADCGCGGAGKEFPEPVSVVLCRVSVIDGLGSVFSSAHQGQLGVECRNDRRFGGTTVVYV